MDNRKRAKYYMNLITISVTCLALVALLFIAIARIRTLMATVKEYEDRISADAGADRLYTADEVEKLLETDMQDAAIMERARIQTQIRKELLQGESMTGTLRSFYSDELVVEDRGGYGFAMIYETLPQNVFTQEDFAPDDKGLLQYAGDPKKASLTKGIRVSSENGEIAWSRVPTEEFEAALVRAGYFDEDGVYSADSSFYSNASAALSYEMQIIPYYQLADDVSDDIVLAGCRNILEHLEDYEGEFGGQLYVLLPKHIKGPREDMTELIRDLSALLSADGCKLVLGGDMAALTLSVKLTELEGIPVFLQQKKDPMYFPYRFCSWEYEPEYKVFGIPGDTGLFYLIDYPAQ